MSRNKRKFQRVALNRIEIPLSFQRDVILEHDDIYCRNLISLCSRINSGKLEPSAFRQIQPALAAAALRRANVSRTLQQQLLAS